ncbi:MAG: NAD(P)-binding domain-containing protein [Pseudomonadota bacterium]
MTRSTRWPPLLASGDVVIDGGNSHFLDTRRREAALAARGLRFLGVGTLGRRVGRARRAGDHGGRRRSRLCRGAAACSRRSQQRSAIGRAARISAPTAPAISSRCCITASNMPTCS